MTGFMKKRRIACVIIMICAIAIGLGGCGEIGQYFDDIPPEVSEVELSEMYEPQTQEEGEESKDTEGSEETEAVREISEIYYGYHVLSESEQTLYLEILDALMAMSGEVTVSTLDSTLLDRIFVKVEIKVYNMMKN